MLLIFTNGGGLVADEINEKKLVAEVVLDANQALADAEKLSEKLEEVEKIIGQLNKSKINFESLDYIKDTLHDIVITGREMINMFDVGFIKISSAKKYSEVLSEIATHIDSCRNKLQLLNVSDNIDSGVIDNYSDMLSQLEDQYSKVLRTFEGGSKQAKKNQDELNKSLDDGEGGNKFAGGINLAITSLRTLNSIFPDTVDGLGEIITQLNTAKQSIAAGANDAISLITSGVSIFGACLQFFISVGKKRQEAIEEALQKSVEAAEASKEEREEVESLAESYILTASTLSEGNVTYSESIELKRQLIDLQDQLAEKYGEEANAIDLINGNVEENINLLREKAVAEAKTYTTDNYSDYADAQSKLLTDKYYRVEDTGSYGTDTSMQGAVSDFIKNYVQERNEAIRKEIAKGNKNLKEIDFKQGNQYWELFTTEGQAKDELEKYQKALEEWAKNNNISLQKIFGSNYQISESIKNANTSDIQKYKTTRDEYQRNQEIVDSGGKDLYKDLEGKAYSQQINENVAALKELSGAYKDVVESGKLDEETLNALCAKYPEIAEYINQTGDKTLDNGKIIQKVYDDHRIALDKATKAEIQYLKEQGNSDDEIKELTATNNLYNKQIDYGVDATAKYKAGLNDLSSAYKTVSEGGKLNESTLQSLCERYPDLANYISETGDLTLGNGEKLKEVYESERKAIIEKLTAKKTDLEYEQKVSKSKEDVAKRLSEVNSELEYYKNLQLEINEQELNWSNISSEVKSLASAYQTLNEGKQLDIDTMISLIDKYPEVAAAMAKEGQLGKDQADVFKQLFEAKKNDYILTQQRTIANLQASADETQGVIENLKVQISAYKAYAEAKGTLKSILPWIAANYALQELEKEYDGICSDIDKSQARIKAMENLDVDTYGKSGGGSDNSNKALANELKQLEHKKAIGQLNSQQEYNWLVRINNKYRKNADEQSDMEKRLYNAKKQMQADEEAANTKALQEAYKGIENKKSLGKMNSQQELRQLEQIRQRYKMTAEERMELEIKIYNLKKSLKDDEISSINTLADAVTEALKQKYEEQRKLEEDRINESIESWQNWEDKTVSAIQGEIDALDELAKKQDSENKRQEYENKRQQTELQLAYEKDDYNRTQLQKELARLDKEEAERLAEEQREAKKKALEGRIEAVKGQSQATQERLNKELDKLGEKYEKLTDSFSLKAQAQKFIADSTQKQIVSLIKSYASDYEIAGNTIGDALYNGMKAKMDNISAYVDGVFGKIEAYQRQMANTANASADRFWASQNSAQSAKKQSSQKAVTVKQTVNFNQPIESPVETRRQLDRTNQALAKQISNGI